MKLSPALTTVHYAKSIIVTTATLFLNVLSVTNLPVKIVMGSIYVMYVMKHFAWDADMLEPVLNVTSLFVKAVGPFNTAPAVRNVFVTIIISLNV